ncbi:MAG: hypothetical protein S4CHLAM123_14440 [Chlamydiales bacterium]|nr:hypothetical protein [Chlamydiales bacterium]
MLSPSLITAYALIPMFVAIIGGVIASFYVLKPKIIRFLQHLVGGIVVGAVAIELIPKIIGKSSNWTIGIGFVIGVAVMLLVHELAHFLAKKKGASGVPFGLVIGAAIDLFIDGMLIGVAFIAGMGSGIVIAISLSLCAFFLNLTISSTMTKSKSSKWLQLLAIVFVSIMLPLGAFVGGGIVSHLPPVILIETIAFGVAALLYLGIEELLAEAHIEHDTAWISAAFFLGFFLILLFRI